MIEECDDYQYEIDALTERYKNKIIVETLYDEVFRPVIKYSDDEKQYECYSEIWEKIHDFISRVKDL